MNLTCKGRDPGAIITNHPPQQGLKPWEHRRTGVPAGEYKVVVSKAKEKAAPNPVNPDKPIPGAVNDEELSPTYADPMSTVSISPRTQPPPWK